ncbi:MAG: hypothetical protein AB1589_06030 [Cyanobacteriota bacterium]
MRSHPHLIHEMRSLISPQFIQTNIKAALALPNVRVPQLDGVTSLSLRT